MPDSSAETLIQLALTRRLLTGRQAEFVRKEAARDPSTSAGELMLRRHYVTADQLRELEHAVRSGAGQAQQPGTEQEPKPRRPRPGQVMPSTDPRAHPLPLAKGPDLPPGAADTGDGRDPAPGTAISRPRQSPGDAEGDDGQTPLALGHPDPDAATSGPQKSTRLPTPAQSADPAGPPESYRQPKSLQGLLKLARHWGCSDLHLSVGRPPFVRLHGQIRYMERDPLTPEESERLVFSPLSNEQRDAARRDMQLDFSLSIPKSGRYRCCILRQRLGWDGAYRIISDHVPKLEELGLPASLQVLTEYNQGLVLISGPGGSGKTTTVASMLDLVNRHRSDHIVTVEDPVEYVLTPARCQITQREVGLHTVSFAHALRAALREDPDIIMVGEMRDLETTSIAISAAETGHLVFGTLHTSTAARTVSRIVDIYPVSQRTQVLTMVAESLRGVVCQQLVPRKDGSGRVLAREVMINTTGIAAQIKEGRTHLITSLIQGGKKLGMVLMDESLMELHRQGLIAGHEVFDRALNKDAAASLKDAD